MSSGQLSLLNDHESNNRLSDTEPSRPIRLQLRYNDRRQGFEKLVSKAQFLPTATIRDVIKEFLKFANLENIRPEDVTFVEYTHDRRYIAPIDNVHMTLKELNIEDSCTLWFEPSLTSVAEEPSNLIIWAPSNPRRVEYRWYKTTTTLGLLLEHVIQTFSLDSIERERIHLFYDFEELDVALYYDKLLRELGIRNNGFIDVEIIPPISSPILFKSTNTSNGLLSSFDKEDSTNRLLHAHLNQRIKLKLQYTDNKQNLRGNVTAQFSPTTTIYDVTKEFLKLAHLDHLHPEDVSLIEFIFDKRYKVSSDNIYKTLTQLTIVDGCTLYFEPSLTPVTIKLWSLQIRTLDGNKKVEYEWNKNTTTLGMLLEYIIEDFSLQSIERKCIHLTTLSDKKFDHTLHSDKLLSDLGVTNYETIYIKIVEPYSSLADNERLNVRVECTHTDGTQLLEVPYTITIEDLTSQIHQKFKDHLVTDMKLLDRMHCTIDMRDPTRTLSYFGVEPGQIVYAALKLVFTRNPLSRLNTGSDTVIRSSSLIAKHQPDEVTVVCKHSTCGLTSIKASVNDTVGDLLKKIETFKKNRPLAHFEIWSESININTVQSNRRLSDFGIVAGDVINVKLVEKIPVKYTLENSRVSTSFMLDNSSRNERITSTPVGLTNLGNTCYMNSALQCLAHTKPLTQFFLDVLMQDVSENNDRYLETEWNQFYTVGTVTGAFADVLRNLWLPTKTIYYYYSFRPDHIKDTIGQQAPRFATYDQQDAQEFMTYLLDEIHKELKDKNGSESSTIIEELFFGKIQSTITCNECQHQVETINPISFLPLPLNQQGRMFTIKFIAKDGDNDLITVSVPENGQVKSIIQAFAEARPSYLYYRTIIVMTDEGQLDLEMPLSHVSAREVMLIEQDDLFSRSQYDRYDRHSKKLTLDGCLREFCSVESLEDSWLCQQETCKKHTKATKQLQFCSLPPILIIQFKRFSHEDGLRQKIETFVDYPIDGLNLTRFLPSAAAAEEEVIYDLFAVSNHMGSIYGGHYIAYARHEANGRNGWYKFDDSLTSSFCSDSDIVSKDAYLLFYIKRNKPKQLTAVTTS